MVHGLQLVKGGLPLQGLGLGGLCFGPGLGLPLGLLLPGGPKAVLVELPPKRLVLLSDLLAASPGT
eukprot:5359879-Lingulodinium_polyedra.AAC.1